MKLCTKGQTMCVIVVVLQEYKLHPHALLGGDRVISMVLRWHETEYFTSSVNLPFNKGREQRPWMTFKKCTPAKKVWSSSLISSMKANRLQYVWLTTKIWAHLDLHYPFERTETFCFHSITFSKIGSGNYQAEFDPIPLSQNTWKYSARRNPISLSPQEIIALDFMIRILVKKTKHDYSNELHKSPIIRTSSE